MTPEISHRCPSCGVAVREAGALFCPECGQPLANNAKNSQPTEIVPDSDQSPAEKETAEETASVSPANPSAPAAEAAEISNSEPAVLATAADDAKPRDSPKADADSVPPTAARRGDKTRERLHRASEVARGVTRGVIEEPAKRVEKIRQVSNVVIEEASYDPSLRFVLVAVGLFVIFVILLVLSKVMG